MWNVNVWEMEHFLDSEFLIYAYTGYTDAKMAPKSLFEILEIYFHSYAYTNTL